MVQTRVAADAFLASTYRAMRKPPEPGQLRCKSWRLAIATAEDDPVWEKRAKEYWERQEQLFGLKFHERYTNLVDNDELVITTYAVIERVLPGERTLSLYTQ